MSRIIKSIINSVIPTENNARFIWGLNNKEELEIVKTIGGQFFSFEKNTADTNNIIKVITDKDLMNDLSICPKYIINTNLVTYQNAQNLSQVLKIPLINFIMNLDNLKKEGAFSLAPIINKNINFFINPVFPTKLFLTNYQIINDIKQLSNLIEIEILKWKPT